MAQSTPLSASDNDKAWFEAHPARTTRLRLPVGNESEAIGDPREGMIIVRQLKPCVPVRLPIPSLVLFPPSVVDGRVLTEPEPICPPASEIYSATEEECHDVWLHRLKPETRAAIERQFRTTV